MKNLKYIAYVVPAVMAYKGDMLASLICVMLLSVAFNEV